MKKIKTFFRRYFILTKRLFKKPGFIIILLLVPLLVTSTKIMSNSGKSGVLTIALAMEDNEDAIANEIVDSLLNDKSLIRFERCGSASEAKKMVKSGNADAAWIFESSLEEKIRDFANLTHSKNAFVTVVQGEENVFMLLSHEKLNAAIYPYIAKAMYRQAVSGNVVDISTLSKEEIDEFYDTMEVEGQDLFDFVYPGALDDKTEDKDENPSFILSPIKGILAIMILISGIAAAMFYIQDESRGAFDRLPRGTGFSFSVIYQSTAVLTVGVATFIALKATGIAKSSYEAPIMALYCLCTIGFCMCLRLLLRSVRLFGTLTPLLVIASAVLCPIFIPAPKLPFLQILLPTFHYVESFTNRIFILYMAIYTVILYALAFALHSMRLKQRR